MVKISELTDKELTKKIDKYENLVSEDSEDEAVASKNEKKLEIYQNEYQKRHKKNNTVKNIALQTALLAIVKFLLISLENTSNPEAKLAVPLFLFYSFSFAATLILITILFSKLFFWANPKFSKKYSNYDHFFSAIPLLLYPPYISKSLSFLPALCPLIIIYIAKCLNGKNKKIDINIPRTMLILIPIILFMLTGYKLFALLIDSISIIIFSKLS